MNDGEHSKQDLVLIDWTRNRCTSGASSKDWKSSLRPDSYGPDCGTTHCPARHHEPISPEPPIELEHSTKARDQSSTSAPSAELSAGQPSYPAFASLVAIITLPWLWCSRSHDTSRKRRSTPNAPRSGITRAFTTTPTSTAPTTTYEASRATWTHGNCRYGPAFGTSP
jgi:hypothetical protein